MNRRRARRVMDERPLLERDHLRRIQHRALEDAKRFQSVALDPSADDWTRSYADRMCSALMRVWYASSIVGLLEKDKPRRVPALLLTMPHLYFAALVLIGGHVIYVG